MTRNKLALLLGALFLAAAFPVSALGSAEYNDSPAFHDLNNMSSQELAAEMRYIIKQKQEKKFYPQDRIDQVEKALVKKQMDEMKGYENKLKQEAAEAKRLQDIKDKAYELAKKQVEKQYEKNEEKIKQTAEDIIKDQVGADKYDKAKDMYEKMEKQGTEYYEKNLKDYADKATKAYDYYNKYQDAKKSISEAPEAAKNLMGALAVTGEALKELGGKLEDTPTPLKIVGQALTAYGEACGLGETGAKVYTRAVHGGDNTINSAHDTTYMEGMKKNGVDLMERSGLQQYDKNLKIFEINAGEKDGKWTDGGVMVFDDKGKPISGPNGDIFTHDQYVKMQEAYAAWQSMKKDGWPELSSEDLVKLATGQKANITLNDRIWPLSDVKKDFNLQDIMDKANDAMKGTQRDTLIKEIDDMTKGSRDFLDGWRQGARNLDISKLFNDYLDHARDTDKEWYKKSDIEQMGNFKDLIERLLKTGRNWNEVKDYIKNMKEKDKETKDKEKEKDKNDPAKDKVKDKLKIDDKNKKDKGKDKPGSNDKNAKDKTGTTGKKDPAKDKEHWTQKNKDDFGGGRDKGFTHTGGETYRPVGDPFALGMPVLKPNIYLYPVKTENVTVAFEYPDNVTTSIPYYNPSTGWQVKVSPSGEIDGKYNFLFYEADVLRQFFQKVNGWTIPLKNRQEKFTEILDLYGFNKKEKDDFIEFWNERLEKDKAYIAYPQETRILDNAMPLEIKPGPDSTYRVWFYFSEAGDKQAIPPGTTEVILRKGFTAVEWGGMVE